MAAEYMAVHNPGTQAMLERLEVRALQDAMFLTSLATVRRARKPED
jgi:hypothetical protein